jgi:GntR family transcriptional repressor for pyruvate dehydrogenase complex
MVTVGKKILSEQVIGQIKNYILENKLGPGDRLPTEQEFSELFGVSRTSIREATKALSFLGIIHSAPRQGLTLAKVDMNKAMEYLSFHFALSHYSKEQILETRFGLESGTLSESMKNISKDAALFQKLNHICDEILAAKTEEDFVRWDAAFHQSLLEASGIEPLIAFHEVLQIFFTRLCEDVSQSRWQEVKALYGKIIRALREKNLATAELLLRKQLDYYVGGKKSGGSQEKTEV